MAVNQNKVTTSITLKVKTGTNNGKDVFKNFTLNKVSLASANEDIYAVAAAVGGLLAYPVVNIYKQDVNELINA